MKEFRKNEQSFYVCEECEKLFKIQLALTQHVRIKHNKRLYFDKWIKDNNEEICSCGKNTKFINFTEGYTQTCGEQSCINKIKDLNNFNKYGVSNTFQLEKVKNKIIENNKKQGVEHIFQRTNVKEKTIQTCIKKYGVEHHLQREDIFQRGQNSRFTLKQFRDTDIWYQASYELDFLNKYFDKHSDIKRGPTIRYTVNGKHKIYHPDFYISSLNLIIEIKALYWYDKNKFQIKQKEKATVAAGFNYVICVDKNYENLQI